MIKRNSKEYKERVRRIIEFETEHMGKAFEEMVNGWNEEYKRDHSKARADIEHLRKGAKEHPEFADFFMKRIAEIEELIK